MKIASNYRSEFRNKLRSKYIPTWVNVLIDIFLYTSRLFHRYPIADNNDTLSCQPLFIISSGRSGTTLLRSMLAVGKQIAIPPEAMVIPTAFRRFLILQFLGWEDLTRLIIALFESSRYYKLWEINIHSIYRPMMELPHSERSLARIIDEIFKQYKIQQFPDASLWGDKSPINTLNLPRIYRIFPHAKYLHLVRDGRDVISSMIEKGTILEYATSRWKNSVNNALKLQDKLSVDNFLEIRYENLVEQPNETLRNICGFINIDYSNDMLDYWKHATTIEHIYYEHHSNLSKPLFTSSIGKWSQRLTPDQVSYINKEISKLLSLLRYT